MSKLPLISSRDCIRVLEKVGFYQARQRGSHIIMRRDEPPAKTVVPQRRELPKGTLRSIIRDAGMTIDEFLALL